MITDITVDKNKRDEFNSVEKMRVLSFTKVLTLEDVLEKMKAIGAINIQSEQFGSNGNLKASLSSSRVKPSSNNENIQLLKQETEMNNLESKNCEVNDHVHHNLPMSTVVGIKKK